MFPITKKVFHIFPNYFKNFMSLSTGADPVSKVGEGAISVIFGSQVS